MLAPTIMAKKRTEPKAKVGRPKTSEPRTLVLGIRASVAWKEWLVEFAEFNRRDMVDTIDEGLEALAKLKGFRPPPKR